MKKYCYLLITFITFGCAEKQPRAPEFNIETITIETANSASPANINKPIRTTHELMLERVKELGFDGYGGWLINLIDDIRDGTPLAWTNKKLYSSNSEWIMSGALSNYIVYTLEDSNDLEAVAIKRDSNKIYPRDSYLDMGLYKVTGIVPVVIRGLQSDVLVIAHVSN